MRLIQNYLFISFALFVGGVQVRAGSPPTGTDGQGPPRSVEESITYDCGDIRAELAFREERLPPDTTPDLRDTLRVTLLRLSVMDRSVSSDDFAAARELFRTFAWIHHMEAICYHGSVTVVVNGMPHGAFFESLDNRADLPRLHTRTLRLSERGIVRMD